MKSRSVTKAVVFKDMGDHLEKVYGMEINEIHCCLADFYSFVFCPPGIWEDLYNFSFFKKIFSHASGHIRVTSMCWILEITSFLDIKIFADKRTI